MKVESRDFTTYWLRAGDAETVVREVWLPDDFGVYHLTYLNPKDEPLSLVTAPEVGAIYKFHAQERRKEGDKKRSQVLLEGETITALTWEGRNR